MLPPQLHNIKNKEDDDKYRSIDKDYKKYQETGKPTLLATFI